MASNSLIETSTVVSDSLKVVNDSEISDNGQDIKKIFELLAKMDIRLNKIETFENRLSKIESFMQRLETVEGKLVKCETSVSRLERQMEGMEKRQRETDTCLDGISNLYDGVVEDVRKKNAETGKSIKEMKDIVTKISDEVEISRDELREEILDLKCRSMRDNLLFLGLPEAEEEDCEGRIKSFIKDRMGVHKEINFERVHRIGRKPHSTDANSRPRPIVAKFSNFKDRELVRKQAPVTLRGTDFRVQEQFPPEIEERRKALYPVMYEARRKKDKVRLVKDRLYINDAEYCPPGPRVTSGTPQRTSPSHQQRKRPRVGSSLETEVTITVN